MILFLVGAETTWAEEEKLPDIQAKTYPVTVIRRSTSNKIYLFDDVENRQPLIGRILLIKKGTEALMAFRVLRLYPSERMIAAKRIKRYGDHNILEDKEELTAIEKISDVVPPPPTSEDKSDMAELEKHMGLKVLPYDPQLDAPEESPKPTKPAPNLLEDVEETEPDEHLAVTVEEPRIFDHYYQWLTAGFGYVRNNGPPTQPGSYYFSSGNLRYGVTLIRLPFLDKPKLQDSIALEAGFYLYKSINFYTTGDAYTAMGVVGTLRYNLLFSEAFGIYFYGGVIQHFVVSATSPQNAVINSLTSLQPAAGGGILFQLGPHWYTRLGLGIDAVDLNLLLRF